LAVKANQLGTTEAPTRTEFQPRRAAAHTPIEEPAKATPTQAWTAWAAVIVIAAAAVVGSRYLIVRRHEVATTMTLSSAVLGAQQVPVGPADAATVASIQVSVGDVVHAGQTLAQVSFASAAAGNTAVLTAPVDGVIFSVAAPAGSVVKAGEPVVTEYSSASLAFVAPIPVAQSKPINATVGAAQASLNGGNPTVVNVALLPVRLSDVSDLVPGLAFHATVQLTKYPSGASSVLRGGR
jgi:multidrug efflux pump subunit AcrA (membrane-fusion protein)